ncbi:hypothetical protein [uncultured Draconibacterium sp.]|uniref:hypothetical protein n=1 Tax=uncultured Draconibacterium sp. TaxID=1573823 RepID=UPI003216FE32
MTTKSFFLKIGGWLQATEMFERPRKKLPGKWQLYEYFVDEKEELLHFEEKELKARSQLFELEFSEQSYSRQSNIPISLIQNSKNGKWSVAKNFVTLLDAENFRDSIEFQFAFEKGNLKLLKKNAFGKIEFFGFFRKINSKV